MSVASRTEILDDLYTSTWNNRSKTVVDQIFDATPFFQALKRLGGLRFNGSGGRYLEIPLNYGKNETVTSFGPGAVISLSDTQTLTVAQYQWKFVVGSVIRRWTDDSQNKSLQQHINLANHKVDVLRDTLADEFERYLFADGSGNGGLDPNGLGNLVSTNPSSGVVGNIDRATYTWWRNRAKAASGAAATWLLKDMRNLFNTCGEGKTRNFPDLIVTTQEVVEAYNDEVLEERRIVNMQRGDAEFSDVVWKGRELIWSARCPANTMYMLNTKYLGLVTDPDYNFAPSDWKAFPNQLDRVMHIVWKGEFVISRAKSQGVLYNIQP